MKYSIIPSMVETLFNPVVSDMSNSFAEIAEIGLDGILEEGLIKDIPILSTIVAICKTGLNLRERHFIRQTALFLKAFNDNALTREKIQSYREELERNPRKAEKEIGRVILLLDRMLEEKQAILLGKLFNAYLSELLTWAEFVEMTEANSRMFVSDYDELQDVICSPIKQEDDVSNQVLYKIHRLESLGLVIENRSRLHGTILHYTHSDIRFEATPLGKKFYDAMVR